MDSGQFWRHFSHSTHECHAVVENRAFCLLTEAGSVHCAFFHTAPSNQVLFERLCADLARDRSILHCVDEGPLKLAQADGCVSDAVLEKLAETMVTLRGQGASLVVCTCSTLGGAVEGLATELGVPALRIDRPMANQALDLGSRLLVAACVPTTIGPTTDLLTTIAEDRNQPLSIELLTMAEFWPLFEDGDHQSYHQAIAGRLSDTDFGGDAIILAQASMAAAADLCGDLSVPVLSSPVIGTIEAIRRFDALVAKTR